MWEGTIPGHSVNFLDLTITIESDENISTKTLQKPMNLYFYILATLTHPTGMIVGVVNSLIARFYTQNSKQSDFLVIKLLFWWLIAQVWDATWKTNLVLQATRKAQQASSQTPTHPTKHQPSNKTFLHLQYHWNDITCTTLHARYKKNCKPLGKITMASQNKMSITYFIVTYSQARHLCDVLTSAKLHTVPGCKVSPFCDIWIFEDALNGLYPPSDTPNFLHKKFSVQSGVCTRLQKKHSVWCIFYDLYTFYLYLICLSPS